MGDEAVCDGEEVGEDPDKRIRRQRKGWSKLYITVEPIKFCAGFITNFTGGVTIDMLQRNICYQNFNLTGDLCGPNMSSDIKSEVTSMTANMNMINQLVQGIFPLFLILFVGPWSDNNGRKPFIVLPLFGFSIYFLSWSIMAYFPGLSMIYLFIPSLVLGMTGGIITLYVCTWSYTSDNFVPEDRPFRFSISIACNVGGGLLGNALAGSVMKWGGHYGFQYVFFTSFGVSLSALIYTLTVLEETIVRERGRGMSNLIDFENVKSMFVVLLIRPEKGVLLSILILVVLLCEIPLNAGDDGILYMVGKSHFNWDLNTYNLVSAISSVISAIAPVSLVMLLIDYLKMSNVTVMVISMSWFAVTEVMKALSINQIMFWSSHFAFKIGGIIGPALDTELSLTVSENNIGKVFTLTSICDALTPLMSVPVYTVAYRYLLPSQHTIYVFFLSAVLATLGLIASVCISFLKSSSRYVRQVDKEEAPT